MGFLQYPKLRRPSHSSTDGLFEADDQTLFITEKFDGNNGRFTRDGDSLRFGSRTVDLGTDLTEIGGQFEQVTDYLDETVTPAAIERVEQQLRDDMGVAAETPLDVVVFGENAVQHTIDDYDWTSVPQFQVFDVAVVYGEPDTARRDIAWVPFVTTYGGTDITDVAMMLGLTTVPLLNTTTVGAFQSDGGVASYAVPESVYRDEGAAEGVVFRNRETGVKAKYLSEEFVEMKQELTGSNTDSGGPETDHEAFCDAHVTNRRIKKNIQKLLTQPDSGYDELSMALMEDLHRLVWHDVWAEDYEEIIATDWILDMDQLHNDTASRCASYLQRLCDADDTPVVAVDPGTGDELATDTDEVEAN